jgi:hypothetical protein
MNTEDEQACPVSKDLEGGSREVFAGRITQPRPIQRVTGALPLGGQRPGREADNSPPSSAEVEAIPPLPNTPSCRGAQLKA